jgi:hypothetical protein
MAWTFRPRVEHGEDLLSLSESAAAKQRSGDVRVQ